MKRLTAELQKIRDRGNLDQSALYHALGKRYLELSGKNPQEIRDIFSRLHDPDFCVADYSDPTGKVGGMAIMDAFRCLVDSIRTTTLIRGIFHTLDSLKNNIRGKLTAVDAGAGTGILSMGLVAAGCDRVIALEINPETYETTRRLLEELKLNKKIDLIKCDATRVDLGDLLPGGADILVSENLSIGLFDEPQYQIIGHLSKYLRPDAKIIPFRGTNFVNLGLSSWQDSQEFVVAANRLFDLMRISKNLQYARVESYRGMDVPFIESTVALEVEDNTPVNTLLISSRFHITDQEDSPVIIDKTIFLGGSYAIRLPTPVVSRNNRVLVSLKYPAGRRITSMNIHTEENRIVFSSEQRTTKGSHD